MLEVIEGGFQTTVQDVGRKQGHSMGIPPSGAQDTFSLRIANLLVGNPSGGPLIIRDDPGAAALEILLAGLKVRALDDHLVAIAGADMAPTVDDARVPSWQSFVLRRGQTLAFGMARSGVRGYLAVRGGIDVPLRLGSRATHLGGKFGGIGGRKLQAGDKLAIGAADGDVPALQGRRYPEELRPRFGGPREIRVVAGPEAHRFTQDSVDTFFSADWKLSSKADRIGMRLIGPRLEFRPGRPAYLKEEAGEDPSNIVIDPGAPVGTIQVPSGVEPIVLAVDSPTIGGFARIACVVSTDMSVMGQTRALEVVRFTKVTVDAAHELIRQQIKKIQENHVLQTV